LPELILIATGSEVSLALDAHRQLAGEGIRSRVVSMPSWDLFEAQSAEYRQTVLPPAVHARVSVEAGSPFDRERYVGPGGAIIGVDRFGASAPGPEVIARPGTGSPWSTSSRQRRRCSPGDSARQQRAEDSNL
jgi:transketolase